MASILIIVLNPLSSTMKTTSEVSVSVFVKLNGVSLRGYSVDVHDYTPSVCPPSSLSYRAWLTTDVVWNSFTTTPLKKFSELPVESYMNGNYVIPYIPAKISSTPPGGDPRIYYAEVDSYATSPHFQGGLILGLDGAWDKKANTFDAALMVAISEEYNNLKDYPDYYPIVYIPDGIPVMFKTNGTEQRLDCFWAVKAVDTWKSGEPPITDWITSQEVLLLAPSYKEAWSWVAVPLQRADPDDPNSPIVGGYNKDWVDDYWNNAVVDEHLAYYTVPTYNEMVTLSGNKKWRIISSSTREQVTLESQGASEVAKVAASAGALTRKEAARSAPKKLSWWEKARGYISAGFEVAGDVLQVVGTVASVAAMVGLSVPATNEPPTNALLGVHNLSIGAGVRTASMLAVDPQNSLDNLTGSGLTDSMMLSNIVTKKSLLGTLKVIPGQAHTEPLVTIAVHPLNCSMVNDGGNRLLFPTYLSFVASAFEFSRCQIRFHFDVVCSAFHSMRFRVSFIPAEGADSTEYNDDGDLSNVISNIFDVQTNSEFDFVVPYLRDYNYLPNTFDPNWKINSAGFISVSILNTLVVGGEDASAPVYLNIYSSASPGAQFAKPTGRLLSTVAQPRSKQYQRKTYPDEFDLPKLFAQTDVVPQVKVAECLERGINVGEQIPSLKPIVSRFGLHGALPPREIFGGDGAILNFDTLSVWSHAVTNDRGELYDNGDFLSRPDPSQTPFHIYFQQIFRGRRGSIAVKYLPGARDNANVQITAFSARDMDGTTAISYDKRGHQIEPISATSIDQFNEGTAVGLATSLSGCEAIIPYYSNLSYIPWQLETPLNCTKTFGLITPSQYPADGYVNLEGRVLSAAGDDFEYVQLMAPPSLLTTDVEPWAPFVLTLPKKPTPAQFDPPYLLGKTGKRWKKFAQGNERPDWSNTPWKNLGGYAGRSVELKE